jgi:hypothetical protein
VSADGWEVSRTHVRENSHARNTACSRGHSQVFEFFIGKAFKDFCYEIFYMLLS